MESEVPLLLPIEPSEDVSNIINYDKLLEPMQTDEKKNVKFFFMLNYSRKGTKKMMKSLHLQLNGYFELNFQKNSLKIN